MPCPFIDDGGHKTGSTGTELGSQGFKIIALLLGLSYLGPPECPSDLHYLLLGASLEMPLHVFPSATSFLSLSDQNPELIFMSVLQLLTAVACQLTPALWWC